VWRWVRQLLDKYPGDVGALAPLYLNLVTLKPGEALFLPAGELHAYLEGTALEIMANSDNVLRGGLTPKHVDAQELLATLVFEPQEPAVLKAAAHAPGESAFATPAREFELGFLELERGREFAGVGGRLEILLQLAGAARLRVDGNETELARGSCVLLPAAAGAYTLAGEGRVARARVPA
jgi:mannose-6-phosphate isomerase